MTERIKISADLPLTRQLTLSEFRAAIFAASRSVRRLDYATGKEESETVARLYRLLAQESSATAEKVLELLGGGSFATAFARYTLS